MDPGSQKGRKKEEKLENDTVLYELSNFLLGVLGY
jgi:hypothetical protein